MAIFSDTFTVDADTTLASHTPDEGTGWTLLWQDGANPAFSASATDDVCKATSQNNSGVIYSACGVYPSADYEVEFKLLDYNTFNTRPFFVLTRLQDPSNFYATKLVNAAASSKLYKKVAGVFTQIGADFTGPAASSICKLEVIGTTLKFYDDGVVVASATDSDISAAGKAGIGNGGGASLLLSTDDANATATFDDWVVTDLSGAAAGDGLTPGMLRPMGIIF